MKILVCVKRVPATGAQIVLTDDEQDINTRYLGFTISPHEECAVEEAIRLVETHGGESLAMTLGSASAVEQLREAMAMGVDEAVLLETDTPDWPPMATARALTGGIQSLQAENGPFDILLFGNESADSGGYQVGIRVAHALDIPCLTGIKSLEIVDGKAIAKREVSGGWEIYTVDLPAVITVKEGINLPRYPSFRGKMRAKKKEIVTWIPEPAPGGLRKIRLQNLADDIQGAEILGEGPDAAAKVVEMMKEIGVV